MRTRGMSSLLLSASQHYLTYTVLNTFLFEEWVHQSTALSLCSLIWPGFREAACDARFLEIRVCGSFLA